MTLFNRRLRAAVSLLLLISMLTACGGGSAPAETTPAPSGETTSTPAAEDSARARDSLPATDFKGESVDILIREEVGYEFNAEQTGDIVNDAVFARNQAIGERFNVTLNYIGAPGLWASKDAFQTLISQSVLAGDSSYDIVTGQSNIIMPLAVQKLYNEIQDSKYIDWSQPYWKDGYTDNVKISGKLYTLCGDASLTTLSKSNVLFFNKKLIEEYKLDSPYALVSDGAWTIDRFVEMGKTAASDLNGDTVFDQNDRYAFVGYNNTLAPFLASLGCALTKPVGDGKREIDFPSERDVEAFDKVHTLVHSDEYFADPGDGQGNVTLEMFSGEKALFIGGTLDTVEKMRDYTFDFGIVPFPKLNEAQKDYRVSVLRTFTLAAIPITAESSEMSEIILEAMACEGYNEIVPAYYEVALKNKYARDAETVEMLDIISTSSWFDFTDCYYSDLGNISDIMAAYARSGSGGIMSYFESQKSTFEANLEALYESYES